MKTRTIITKRARRQDSQPDAMQLRAIASLQAQVRRNEIADILSHFDVVLNARRAQRRIDAQSDNAPDILKGVFGGNIAAQFSATEQVSQWVEEMRGRLVLV